MGIILRTTSRCMFMLVSILSALLLIGKCATISLTKPKLFFSLYHYQQDLSRRDGYLDFYRRTRLLRRTPLLVISAGKQSTDYDELCFTSSPRIGNAILVALIKLLEDYQSDIPVLKPWHCLAILTSIEVIITLIALIWYLGKIGNDHVFFSSSSNIFFRSDHH